MADRSVKIISMGKRLNVANGSSFHTHDFAELVYFSSGNGTYVCGEKEFAFGPHTLIYIPTNVPHAEFCDTSFSNFFFLTNAELQDQKDALVYEDFIDREMESLFTQLRYHYFHRCENFEVVCALIVELMLELIKSKKRSDGNGMFIDRAISIISENYANPEYDVNIIYDNVPFSKVYFASLFKKTIGMPPTEYLAFVRIESAKAMLLSRNVSSKLTVNELSELSGFTDSAYFSRIFKKYTGASPLNWLKEHKV